MTAHMNWGRRWSNTSKESVEMASLKWIWQATIAKHNISYDDALNYHLAGDDDQQKARRDDILKRLEDGSAWGGSETLGAVARLRKVNFVQFRDVNGKVDVRFVDGFTEAYKRTICLHYNGTHYNSVCRIDGLDALAQHLANPPKRIHQ